MRVRGCVTVLVLAAVLTGAAAAAPAPPTQAQVQAAEAACKAQGLTPPSAEFRQCVGKTLAGGQGGGQKPPSGSPPPQAQAAFDACTAKGLKPGNDDFNQCVKAWAAANAAAQHPSGPPPGTHTVTGPGAPNAAAQAAIDGCKASGVTPGTDAFKACVRDATAAASVSGWTGEQLAALNVCKAQGITFPSAAFAACLSKVLTKLIPDKGDKAAAKKDVGAAVAACQAKKLTGPALNACVKSELNS